MDEWMVDRPHDNRFRGVVCESSESKPKRGRLLASQTWIYDRARRCGNIGATLDHGQHGTQVTFGCDPNHRIEEALTGGERRLRLGVTEACALTGGEDGTGNGDDANG
jgi:hypothetical protein